MNLTDFPDVVLTGWTGAGKSTVANLLKELGYQPLAFAGRAEAPHHGSPRDMVTRVWGPAAINDRTKLVTMANCARSVDPDVWLRALEQQLDQLAGPNRPRIVVDDARFENEFYGLKGRGFVSIRVTAPLASRIDRLRGNGKWLSDEYLDDAIEHYLDKVETDYTLENDGSLDELFNDLIEILAKERKKR